MRRTEPSSASRPDAVTTPPRRPHERGFSVLELLVALFIAVEILIAMAIAFDVHNKVARVQLQITDMQQSLRIAQWDIARMLRQTGRGGLKADLEPGAVFNAATTPDVTPGRAIEVWNNYAGRISRTDATSPTVFTGTDVLVVRGCFSTQLFQVNPGTFDGDLDDDDDPGDALGQATITIPPQSVAGVPQDFTGDDIALGVGTVLMSSYASRDDWGVGDIVDSAVDADGNLVLTLQLATGGSVGGDVSDSPLNPRVPGVTGPRIFPTTLAPSQVCLLEEYRYYIRDVREAGDEITPLRPRLTRARFEPGTEDPYQGDDGNYSLDLADQVFDLQIALGFDTEYASGVGVGGLGSLDGDDDYIGVDDVIYEAAADSPPPGRTEDDWLYNDPDDAALCDPNDPADGTNAGCVYNEPFLFHSYADLDDDPVDLYFVRVTTAARTFRPDASYEAPDLDTRTTGDWLEDNDYDEPANAASVFNNDANRKHRRRTLTTIVEMRSI